MKKKIVSARDAARLIHDGDTLTTSGFVGIGVPDELLLAIEQRFLETGEPRGLSLLFAAGQGDGKTRGLNRLGHPGLLRRVVGGHWGLIPKVGALCLEGQIEGYNLPQGVISHLYRDIAAGKPGTLTHVGLDTFVDPRSGGGKINDTTTEDLVERIEIAGRELLFYKALPINVALLRGTTADALGNISMENEALVLDNLAQAMAVRNCGGIVIVQVERTCAAHMLSPRDVVIPSALVDAVVIAEPDHHRQTYATEFSPYFASQLRAADGAAPPLEMSARKIIARRVAFELPMNGVVNLGIGMPEGVAAVAAEEGLLDHVTLTAEPGVIGGQPASGLDFGAAINMEALIHQNQQFDFYDGGGLDLACLGMAEVDVDGNVNVSRFGTKLAGAGGFINISQNAQTVVFAGTFTAGGLEVRIEDGKVWIDQEGRARKFRAAVEQVTFSGKRARKTGQRVLYVTERCVLELTDEGLRLSEVAPGIDIESQILPYMDVEPIVEAPRLMDPRIFHDAPMGLKADLLHIEVADRIALDPEQSVLFINFEKIRISSLEQIDEIRRTVEDICQPVGHRVDVVVNYDGARIDDEVAEAYVTMVEGLEDRFYANVTRYSGSAFMRMKHSKTGSDGDAPRLFESARDARDWTDRFR